MTKLSDLSYWQVKGLQLAIQDLIWDNPDLREITVMQLDRELVEDLRRKKNARNP